MAKAPHVTQPSLRTRLNHSNVSNVREWINQARVGDRKACQNPQPETGFVSSCIPLFYGVYSLLSPPLRIAVNHAGKPYNSNHDRHANPVRQCVQTIRSPNRTNTTIRTKMP